MEAVRSGGDLSNLLTGASKHSDECIYPDGVVVIRLDAFCND